MKLSHALALSGLALTAVGLVATPGCSSSDNTNTGTTTVGAPPAKPSAPKTTSTEEHNFALHKLYLGDKTRAGVASSNAWKDFGYNLDGKVTTASSTDVCTLAPGVTSKNVQADGTNGIDNSFGANIVPIIRDTAGTDAADKINAAINGGSFTVMLDTVGLADSDTKQTATGLTALLLAGGSFSSDPNTKPTWSKADVWPVRPELLNDPNNPKSSKISFSDSYVTNGTWVAGTGSDLTLSLAIGGVALDLKIHNAVITFDHTSAGHATNGTIAGVINTEELITALKGVAGRISTSLCGGQAFDTIANQIRQASDIMSNGTNAAGTSCDAISIGLGFDADEIGPPSKVAGLAQPTPDPCAAQPDAGAPDSGTTPEAGPADAAGD